jgi:hypothetical protein
MPKRNDEIWYKLCAVAIFKLGLTEIAITGEDVDKFMASGLNAIVAHAVGETMMLTLMPDAEARWFSPMKGTILQ